MDYISKNQPLLLQLASSIAEGVSIHDENGYFIEINDRLCESLGYSKEELLELKIHDVFDKPFSQSLDNAGSLIVNSEDVEIIALTKNGKKLHFLTSIIPIIADDGSINGSFNIWHDISSKIDKEKNTQFLKELEDIVAWISVQFINMPWHVIDQGITWLLGDLGMYLNASRVIVFGIEGYSCKLLHSWLNKNQDPPAEQLETMPPDWLVDRLKAKERVAFECGLDIHLSKVDQASFASIHVNGAGALACIPILLQDDFMGFLWIESLNQSFSWTEGIFAQLQLVSILIANALDRKKTGEMLRSSEERYRTLAETAQEFIVVYNTEGKIMYANRAAILASDYTEDELYKKSVWDFIAPEDYTWSEKNLEALMTTPEAVPLGEITLRTKGGRSVPVEMSSAILSREGDKLDILAICRDVTKRRELDKMRSDFIIMASHELKTPMVSILGASDFLATYFKQEMSERAYGLVEMIKRGSYRLRNLISELIDVSRIETSKFTVKKEPNDLVKIAIESIQSLYYLLDECQHIVQTDFPEALIARVDPQRLDQVFTNLVSNAAKNSPRGGKSMVKIERSGKIAIISVQDNGVGLTPEEMGNLFEKFAKIERSIANINIQGSGLGLFISKQIVEAHGGKIWAESGGRDKGSTFFFTIPLE
jgi:PAS domain S-box-containing protein